MKRTKLALVGGTLVAAVLACYAPGIAQAATVSAARPAATNPNTIVGKSVDQSWAQLNAFWTPARIAAEEPLPLPAAGSALSPAATIPAGPQETAPPTSPTAPGAIPASLPGKTSRLWTNHKALPATAIGRLSFFTGTGTSWCTATLVNAPNKDTIWTAGHCVSDGHGHEYEDFVFTPDVNGKSGPFGTFKAKYISAPAGWVAQSLYQYDYAAIALAPSLRGKAQNLAGAEGWIMGGNTYKWAGAHIFGYPSVIYPSKQRVNATQLRFCTGSTVEDRFQERFACDMGQGSSGGPLIYRLTAKTGWVVGNVSHGDQKGTIWSPQLSGVALTALKLAYKK